jgi:hypothetical protein
MRDDFSANGGFAAAMAGANGRFPALRHAALNVNNHDPAPGLT